MNRFQQFTKYTGLIGTTLGSILVGISAISNAALAEPVAQLPRQQNMFRTQAVLPLSQIRVAEVAGYPRNPCPSIYYEWPYNQRVVVPQVCRPNAITQRLGRAGLLAEVRNRRGYPTGTPGLMGAPYRDYPNQQ
ncbi:hypothetical protein AB0758_45450 [Tolypothrix bouteillei VB521301_2]|uniref:Uncharacterized protein n=1 Tax=Tolypothrix bouteillei VB521301 TaxID=1479485 RepID=A0A0C1RPL4_9CYAN